MSSALDTPITWLSAVRLGLGWAGEYALLSLIEDAPESLKVATVICAVGALAALEGQLWLNRQRKNLFIQIIAVLSVTYLAFIAYAIGLSTYEANTRKGLEDRYAYGSNLARKPINPDETGKNRDPKAVAEFASDVGNWEAGTADWLLRRMSAAARERFLERSSTPSFLYLGPLGDDPNYDQAQNRLGGDLRNLATILETKAYDR